MAELRLAESARAVLDSSDEDRIRFLTEPRWITYDRAAEVLARLDDLYATPKRDRMPCMLLVGETNNGKTELIKRFLKSHPADENLDGDSVIQPILYVQAPPGPNEGALYDQILKPLFQPHRANETIPVKRDRVLHVLDRIQLRLLVIDEIHHLLSGSPMQQRNFLNALKFLTNELRIPIVAVGTGDAERAMATADEVENRFLKEPLPRWVDSNALVALMSSFEAYMPLRKPSGIYGSEELTEEVVSRGDGKIGEMSTFLITAAIHAIRTGVEQVTMEVLKECGYLGPIERKDRVKLALRRG